VPFQGGGPAALGVLNGQVDCGMNIPPEGLTNIEAGQLRVLGVMANERFPQFPDVPTVREQGVDTSYSQWRGVVVHKDVPKEIVQRIHDIFKQCLEDEEFKKKMFEMSVTIAYANGEDYGKEIEQDDKNYEQVIKANKLGDRYK
jgi:tripartite-type tricarboxylate transporter receptor subunit TctC